MPQRLPYTPSNYLNIYNLLSQVSEERFQYPIQFEKYIHKKQSSPGYIAGNGIYTNITLLDLSDSTLEKLSCENQLSFTFPSFDIEVRLEHDNTRPHTISIKNGLTLPIKNMNDVNFFNAYFRTMKIIRDWLAQDKLTAYVLFNNNYHKIPNNVWVTDENWYRLLADGQINECISSIVSHSEVRGIIYFQKSDVDRLLCKKSAAQNQHDMFNTHQKEQNNPLINLSVYDTPWLQVLQAIHIEHGNDSLASVSKESIEAYINSYIEKHNLDIAKSDIPYLAKFMRLAEQKKGKAYKPKNKKA